VEVEDTVKVDVAAEVEVAATGMAKLLVFIVMRRGILYGIASSLRRRGVVDSLAIIARKRGM
jgi:hypothetical protein